MNQQNRLIYIRGNHEDLLVDATQELIRYSTLESHHKSNGTQDTIQQLTGLNQFDILFYPKLVEERLQPVNDLISSTINYFQLGTTVFTHGWLPTTIKDGRLSCSVNWEKSTSDWCRARWRNGIDMFRANIVPSDITTIVCGHWHSSYAWSMIKHQGTEFGDDAIFEPFIYFNDDTRKSLVALDCCTAYSHKCGCVVFSETGIILRSNFNK